jgi:non-homologous end joining protein Ku
MLHKKDLSRVKEVWYCAEEDKPIERSEIVKGYEVEKDEYLTVEDEELKKIAPTTATTMEVLQFVGSDDVDPLLFESSYTWRLKKRSASLTPCSWRCYRRRNARPLLRWPCITASTSF